MKNKKDDAKNRGTGSMKRMRREKSRDDAMEQLVESILGCGQGGRKGGDML